MSDFDPTAKFKLSFFQECDDLLLDVERLVQDMGKGDEEALNALFRAVHTIKGGAGMFNFARLVAFAHVLEGVLDRLRDRTLKADARISALVLRACDVLADLIQSVRDQKYLDQGHEAAMIAQLNDLSVTGAGTTKRLVIKFIPEAGLFKRGSEPQLIFSELAELGKIAVNPILKHLPSFDDLTPANCYLGWAITIETNESEERLRKVFEFVEGGASLEIVPDQRSMERRAPELPASAPVGLTRSMSSIRVDLDRVDKLVNQVGEIAIVQSMIEQQSGGELHATHPQLEQAIGQLSQLIQGLQDSVMAIRAVPVGSVFARMSRLVRELAAATGKQLTLSISGEETEIDKTVIEQLGDPLMHMIRNAVDHGIELPSQREASGKPAAGVIGLSARQWGGQIIIEVTDDGRGLDLDKIRRKALEKGLISANANFSDDEIVNLIFQPGFSTAEGVTDISGRGVGMDVVRRNIHKLGGRVSIKSEAGRGSRMSISLPLTLAILSGMIVRSGAGIYVIPLSNILECQQASPDQIKKLPDLGEVFHFRGRYVPLIRMGAVLNTATSASADAPMIIVVSDEDGNTLGVAVDEITGQQQVVFKSLRDNVDQLTGISGATVLGDGTIALILVLNDLLALHRNRIAGRMRSPPSMPGMGAPLQLTA